MWSRNKKFEDPIYFHFFSLHSHYFYIILRGIKAVTRLERKINNVEKIIILYVASQLYYFQFFIANKFK